MNEKKKKCCCFKPTYKQLIDAFRSGNSPSDELKVAGRLDPYWLCTFLCVAACVRSQLWTCPPPMYVYTTTKTKGVVVGGKIFPFNKGEASHVKRSPALLDTHLEGGVKVGSK